MARPTKFTAETTKKLIEAISVGATYEHACGYAGVHYDTFNEWMKRGAAAKSGPYSEFSVAIKEAEAKAVIKWSALIDKAATNGEWQAAAWKLERRYPHIYGKRVQEITGNIGVTFSADDAAAAKQELDGWQPDSGSGATGAG